ncbi:MAG: ATP-binding protein [Rubrivivax sp.]
MLASYAYKERKNIDNVFKMGEGLVGQCALEKDKILLTNVPTDYIKIASGLGEATPLNIIVMPVVFEGQVKAVLELASFDRFSATHETFLDQLTESIGIVLNTIEANMRTEDLLKQSQSLARELQSQQEELQQTNAELEDKAKLLADQNVEVERKNKEVEQARQALEEKAKQLALTSKYKSEFLANMSHELRTPLNSLLILSDQLSKNNDGNLTGRQVEFARTIHSSGNDLLTLINDILDLSKIESGTVVVDIGEVPFRDLADYVERTFRHVAENKKLSFEVNVGENVPRALQTDAKRLQQILKNLLSNSFKFTDAGSVRLDINVASEGWNIENEALNRARHVIGLTVSDTGIGIPQEKQQIIFEAFQQADGSTSRKYGGTGLGLAISREIAGMLGGEIRLISTPGEGSIFTLYLPQSYAQPRTNRRGGAGGSTAAETTSVLVTPQPADEIDSGRGQADAVTLADDANNLMPGDKVVLIVENDPSFARLLLDVAHDHQFKAVIATRGAAAIKLAGDLKPAAITLDINLPDIDGWRVLEPPEGRPDAAAHPRPRHHDRRGARAWPADGRGCALIKPLKNRESLDQALVKLESYLDTTATRRVLLIEPNAERRAQALDCAAGRWRRIARRGKR